MTAQTQVRQFLKAFRNVDTFHDAFGQLDGKTQSMVQAFLDGGSAEDVTKKSGFALPPSPGMRPPAMIRGYLGSRETFVLLCHHVTDFKSSSLKIYDENRIMFTNAFS